jgi:hypothetical protein
MIVVMECLRMNRLAPKIAVVAAAFLLGMNIGAGTAVAVAPCPPSICCGGSMHHDAVLKFELRVQKCCDECTVLPCGLSKDPLQDVKPVQPTLEIGYSVSPYALIAQSACIFRKYLSPCKSWPLLAFEPASNPVPLYIEHLSLII